MRLVSLKQLQSHLILSMPGFKEYGISLDTIQHLMVAPRINAPRAPRYKSLIDAKVPKKRNQ